MKETSKPDDPKVRSNDGSDRLASEQNSKSSQFKPLTLEAQAFEPKDPAQQFLALMKSRITEVFGFTDASQQSKAKEHNQKQDKASWYKHVLGIYEKLKQQKDWVLNGDKMRFEQERQNFQRISRIVSEEYSIYVSPLDKKILEEIKKIEEGQKSSLELQKLIDAREERSRNFYETIYPQFKKVITHDEDGTPVYWD